MANGLKIVRVRTSSLTLDPNNPREHPPESIAAIAASLRQFGQALPIVVDKRNVVIGGNGTLEAARSLGWEHIDIVRTDLEGDDAAALAIALNGTAERSHWNAARRDEALSRLKLKGFDLAALGFSVEWTPAPLPSLSTATATATAANLAPTREPEPEPEPEPRNPAALYPLAITLTRPQFQAWKAKKASLGIVADALAFVKLMELDQRGES